MITGAPTYMLYTRDYTAASAWSEITTALNRGFNVGCDTTSSSAFGLPSSHAYAVIGAYTLKDSSGKAVTNLLHVRNPWNTDNYSGPW